MVIRPLINYRKEELIKYAKDNQIIWREDITNQDTKYLRNYIRQFITPKINNTARTQLITLLNRLASINREIDDLIEQSLNQQKNKGSLDRFWFSHLPHNVAKEIFAGWLRANNIRNFDSSTLERLVIAGKVGSSGQKFPVQKDKYLKVYKDHLALE
jgi:tRNA(Ile)-lysidine synthase TilS/MesJ